MTTRLLHASDSYVAADTPAVDGLERAVDRRKAVGGAIETRIGPDETATGRYATVRRTAATRRSVRDRETVFEALERAVIDRSAVLDIGSSKLRESVEEGAVAEGDVFDLEERTYVRRQALSIEE